MTNREKFAEKILDIACSGGSIAVNEVTSEPMRCQGASCKYCLFRFNNTEFCTDARKNGRIVNMLNHPLTGSKVAVDTPILITYSGIHSWVKRHFAKYENGRVYAWNHGKTSWTGEMCTVCELAKLPERSSNGEINN